MDEINIGDYVVVNSSEPQGVIDVWEDPVGFIDVLVTTKDMRDTVRCTVPVEWCKKAQPPFDPQVNSVWLDKAGHVWQCVPDWRDKSNLFVRLVDGVNKEPKMANETFGPMVQLVPVSIQ